MPKIVRSDVPVGVEVEVVIFRVELPAPVIEAGVKIAEAPVGSPARVS